MKKIPVILLFCILLVSIGSAEAQNPAQAFGENLKSGAISNSLGNFGKDTIFLWYTTVGGELNPQYGNQRKILDSIIFFCIFLGGITYALKKAWKDTDARTRNIVAIGASLALTFAFISTGISIGFLLPFVNNLFFILFTVGFTLFLTSLKDKDGKAKIGLVQALLISILLSWAAVNFLPFMSGKGVSVLGSGFDTEKQSSLASRVMSGGYAADSGTNYELALAAVQQFEYEKAQDYFLKVVERGPSNNPYYMKTAQWITIREGDKLFKHMAEHYPAIIAAERAAADLLLDKAEKLDLEIEKLKGTNPNDPKITELETQKKTYAEKAVKYYRDMKEKEKILNDGFANPARGIKLEGAQ